MHDEASSQQSLSKTLIGAWELVLREDFTHNGGRHVDTSLGTE